MRLPDAAPLYYRSKMSRSLLNANICDKLPAFRAPLPAGGTFTHRIRRRAHWAALRR